MLSPAIGLFVTVTSAMRKALSLIWRQRRGVRTTWLRRPRHVHSSGAPAASTASSAQRL